MNHSSILGVDAGEKRVGVAIANVIARLPRPYTTLPNDEQLLLSLKKIAQDEDVGLIVLGLPRNLEGEETGQTAWVREFAESLKAVELPIVFHDEALSSKAAEEELLARGKSYAKVDIDALAAAYILADYLESQKGAS